MKPYDAVVAGGGVIGASIALELASAGLKVGVFDAQKPGREASWASAGMISPSPDGAATAALLPLSLASVGAYPEFLRSVEELSGKKTGYRKEGALDIFLTQAAEAEIPALVEAHRKAGLRAETVNSEQACALEPEITAEIRGGIVRPDEASLDNRIFTEGVLEAAQCKGAEIHSGNGAKALWMEGNVCKGLQVETSRVEARWTIVAAGCFSAHIEGAAPYAPVVPAKGQMIALRCDTVKIKRNIWCEHIYLVPRTDGRIIAGATIEYEGFDRSVTAAGLRKILNGAIALVPGLEKARIEETWAGLRPDSPDHLPILGPTDRDGLLIATGHFRSGILLAPVTARLIREWVTTQKVSVDWAPFSPMRFQKKQQMRTA